MLPLPVVEEGQQRLLQPLDARDVEVVGRFVQEQEVRASQDQRRDLQAGPLPAAEPADAIEHVVAGEEVAVEKADRRPAPTSASARARHSIGVCRRIERLLLLSVVADHDRRAETQRALRWAAPRRARCGRRSSCRSRWRRPGRPPRRGGSRDRTARKRRARRSDLASPLASRTSVEPRSASKATSIWRGLSTGAGVLSSRSRSSASLRRMFSAREANFGFCRAHWVSCSALALSFWNSRSCSSRSCAPRSSRARFSRDVGGVVAGVALDARRSPARRCGWPRGR